MRGPDGMLAPASWPEALAYAKFARIAMIGCFRRRYGLAESGLTHAELQAARELARSKFTSSEWTARLP